MTRLNNSAGFHFTIRETADATIVDMRGDLTKSAEQELLGRGWENGLDGGRKYLLLNFSGVPYINSAGIAVLIRLTQAGIKAGVATFAYGLSPHYQKLFRMVGLTEFMMSYPDEHSILHRIDELRAL